ncbi:MAG: hypothetical protein WDW38_000135 [Sanguina aurantia]
MSAAVTKTVVDLTNKFNKMALQYSALHLARALPEARFRSVFSNISHLGEDIPEFLLLSAVGDRDLEMLRLLLLQTMRQVVERIHAEKHFLTPHSIGVSSSGSSSSGSSGNHRVGAADS